MMSRGCWGVERIKIAALSCASRSPTRHQLAIRTSLERNRLVARSGAVPERAHRLCRLVVEAGQHLVQFERSEGEHEPLDVGSGQVVHGFEA